MIFICLQLTCCRRISASSNFSCNLSNVMGLVCCSSNLWNLFGGCFLIMLSSCPSSSKAMSKDNPFAERFWLLIYSFNEKIFRELFKDKYQKTDTVTFLILLTTHIMFMYGYICRKCLFFNKFYNSALYSY